MAKTLKINDLLDKNPQIDRAKVEKAMEYLDILEDRGVKDFGFEGGETFNHDTTKKKKRAN